MEICRPNGCIYLKDLFPKFTEGYMSFPLELEGRVRRADVLDQRVPGPLSASKKYKTISEILFTDVADLELGIHAGTFETRIQRYVWDQILYSPEDRFVAELIFEEWPELREEPGDVMINPTYEPERREVIFGLLEDLASQGEMKRDVVDLSFGITNWRPLTNQQMMPIIGLSIPSIKRQRKTGLDWLRNSSNTKRLNPFLPTWKQF